MIHINYPNNKKPRQKWLKQAKTLTDRLKAAPDKAARDKIINDYSHFWGEIKGWLEGFSYGKCWFSEARDLCSHWQVEHFRPKKEAKDPTDQNRDGYWWLAFDYLNYRLCGGVVNAKKGSYFPLRAGTTAAKCPEDNCDDESPLLIDPTVESDVILLTFAEGGKAVPSESEEGWHRERALKSIERYKLNDHPALTQARRDLWNACLVDAERMEFLIAQEMDRPSPSRKQEIKEIAKRLHDRTRPTSLFSSVARAFLSQHPKAWARRLIS